ncbi:ATP-binding protein [Clostridioides difficile]
MPLLLLLWERLGGGKSFCNNLLVYYAVLFGGQALLLDPKSQSVATGKKRSQR